ncbi:MAG: DUF2207 domain-containing protein [Thermaerobacter sp.]
MTVGRIRRSRRPTGHRSGLGAAGAAPSLLAILALLVLLALPAPALPVAPGGTRIAAAQEKSVTFPEARIEAVVEPDGSLLVTESRTYRFQGSYSWWEQWIPHGDYEVAVLGVGEPGLDYEAAGTGLPGTYAVTVTPGYTQVRWHFQATNEDRTFVLRYRAAGAVAVHDDVAELYWQFIGDGWEAGTGRARVELTLPDGAGDVLAWGHGPLHGEVFLEEGRVIWDVLDLPPETMLEGRVVFDPAAVPGGRRTGRAALPAILAEERALAAQADRLRWIIRLDLAVALVALIVGPVALVRFVRRHGRDPKPDWTGAYYRELPGDYGPAELTRLLSRDPWSRLGPGLAATLLDLARRGHVRLEPVTTTTWLGRTKEDLAVARGEPRDGDVLQPHERLLVDFLLGTVAAGAPELRLSTLSRWFSKHQEASRNFLRQWNQLLDRRSEELGFWTLTPEEEQRSRRDRTRLALGSAAALVLVWLVNQWTTWTELVLVPLAAAGLLAALLVQRRSQYGSNQKARWDAFRRFLLHFSRLDLAEVPAVTLWEHYLVFATVLGVAEQVLKQMKELLPKLQERAAVDPTRYAVHTAARTFSAQRLEAMNRVASGGAGGLADRSAAGDGQELESVFAETGQPCAL